MSIALALGNLGAVAWRRGELDQAEALERKALAMAREVGDVRRCAEELEQLVRTAGAPDRTEVEQAVAEARAALGEEQWAATFAAGQALSLEEAIAEALGEAGHGAG